MSGNTAAIPKNMIKNCVLGSSVTLMCYVVLQLISALLVHNEIAGEDMIYPMVCGCAAISSFAGCVTSVVLSGKGNMLSVPAVVLIFLSLTLTIGLFAGGTDVVAKGFVGICVSMAAGGLAAAILAKFMGNKRCIGNARGKRGRLRK